MKRMFACAAVVASLAVAVVLAQEATQKQTRCGTPPGPSYAPAHFVAISPPEVHRNLAIYLVHSVDKPLPRRTLTLKEALELRQIQVHETGDVNQLAVENRSKEWDIYIQAGEIVRGGKQDRVLGVDLLLSPGSGRVPINSFCVERGRWQQRGDESVSIFGDSSNSVVGNEIKIAVRKSKAQGEVWAGVARVQQRLAGNVAAEVRAPASPSSLELTLEDETVQKSTAEYIEKLAPLVGAHPSATGYIIAVNGEIRSGDLYGARDLFVALWPKLLEAAAVEALADREHPKITTGFPVPPSVADVLAWLTAVESAPAEMDNARNGRLSQLTRENDACVMFESWDVSNPTGWLHRSYIAKSAPQN